MMSPSRFVALTLAGTAVLAASCTGSESEADPSPQTTGATTQEAGTPSSAATATVERPAFPGWDNTDFSRTTVPLEEILTGCAGRDCIPPLDAVGAVELESSRAGTARFAPASSQGYAAQLPVAVVTVDGITKGYPLHILTWHEIVNDYFGDRAVAVTFCPLCNTAISFDRRVDGQVLDFGVSGKLRNSDLIMWDRQTESWWQQATGEAIVGSLAGERLEPLPTTIVSFGEFAREHPDALVLTEETGFDRAYGVNPYEGYDGSSRPFLFDGEPDPRLPALSRVVTLNRDGRGFAIPLNDLAEAGVANVTIDETAYVVFWAPGATSALDGPSIEDSREIGSAAVYEALVDGAPAQFSTGTSAGEFVDDATGSTWNVFGRATAGPSTGSSLVPVFHTTEFWFAWAAFYPETELWESAAQESSSAPQRGAEDRSLVGRSQPLLPAGDDPEMCNFGTFEFPCWQHDEGALTMN